MLTKPEAFHPTILLMRRIVYQFIYIAIDLFIFTI